MAWRLRGCLFSAVLAIAVAGGPLAKAGCGDAPDVSKPDGLSWIHARTTLFGVGKRLGVFRLRLGSDRPQPIGHHAGASPDDLYLSGDRTKLIYSLSDASGASSGWIYDLKTGRETPLHPLVGDIDVAATAFSPDVRQIAWVDAGVYDPPVSIQDLRTGQRSSYRLPNDAPDKGGLLFGLTWSHNGDRVLVARRRYGLGEDFFAIDPRSGAAQKIEGRVQGGPADTDGGSIHYYRHGVDIGNDCIGCRLPPLSRATLLGRAEVLSTSAGDIVIRTPRGPDVVVATARREASIDGVIMTCGPAPPAIRRVIDQRYIIYTQGGGYWVYGVVEKRRARLPGSFLVW